MWTVHIVMTLCVHCGLTAMTITLGNRGKGQESPVCVVISRFSFSFLDPLVAGTYRSSSILSLSLLHTRVREGTLSPPLYIQLSLECVYRRLRESSGTLDNLSPVARPSVITSLPYPCLWHRYAATQVECLSGMSGRMVELLRLP